MDSVPHPGDHLAVDVATRSCSRCGIACVAAADRCHSCRARLRRVVASSPVAASRGTGLAAAEAWEARVRAMSVEAPGGTEVRGPTVDVGRTQALGVDAWAAVAGLRLTRAAIVAFAVTHAARAALALVASEVELSASPWWSRLGDAISVTTFATGVVAGATIVLLALWWFDAARAGNPVGRRRGTVEHLAGRAAVTTALGALALGSVSAASSSIAAVAAAAAGLTVVQALAGLVAAVTAAEVRWAEQACRVAAAVRQR